MKSSREAKIKLLVLREEKERRLCERSYYEFFKRAWKVLEPETPLLDNWHVKYLCDLLQAEVERIAARKPKDRDIIINISPRSAKSYIVSICFAPWAWTRFPHLKFINSSHSRDLSTDHSVESRRLIQSAWYQRKWGSAFRLTSDQNVKTFYRNNRGGKRYSTSVKGGPTGHGADIVICDDLLDPKKARSEAERKTANDHYGKTLFSRLNDQTIGLRVIVMQRLHEDDPTGHVLVKNPDKYRNICIPAEFNEEDPKSSNSVQPPELKKFYKDGLFFPERFTREFLNEALKGLGAVEYAGQYLQRPSPPEGNIFKRANWKFYDELPPKLDVVIQSWDMTFKDTDGTDYVVGFVIGRAGSGIYLIARIRRRMSFTETIRAFVSLTQTHPQARKKLIEDKANGPAVEDTLKNEIQGIKMVPPRGSKTERAHAVSYLQECGNCYLPNPEKNAWVYDFMEELEAFPNGKNDDQVDAYTQGLDELSGGISKSERLKALLQM